ncbi:MAG: ribulose phosphate epimerase [Nannocystaceae bacterium]
MHRNFVAAALFTGTLTVVACTGGDPSGGSTGNVTTTASGSDSDTSTTMLSSSDSDTTGSSSNTAPTSNSDTSTGTTAATTDTTGCTFLDCNDAGIIDGGCDPWSQDCPEGEKCNAWANNGGNSWNADKCVPLEDEPKAPGDICTVQGSGVSGLDDCDKGAMCWNVDAETSQGYCVAFCEGDEEKCTADPESCCESGFSCTIANMGSLILCLQACDPIVQDCLGQGEVCYPVNDGFQCAPDTGGEMGAIGEPCEFINVCDPGTFCGNTGAFPGCDPNAGGCCIPFCELDAPDCPAETECQPWYDPMTVPPGYENLGACVIPQ